jgi:predicted Zn-dependent protease
MSSARNTPDELMNETAIARPVLDRAQLTTLAERIVGMTSAGVVEVNIEHKAQAVCQIANGRVVSADNGDAVTIGIRTTFGERGDIQASINQFDDLSLRSMVEQCEAIARTNIGYDEPLTPRARQTSDTFVPVNLWHEETVRAMHDTSASSLADQLALVSKSGLDAAGFLGMMAHAQAVITKEGIFAFSEETDSECTITARHADGTGSGWAGQSARNWGRVNVTDVVNRAVELGKRSLNPVAFEPGRRVAILGPDAVIQLVRFLTSHYNAFHTDAGGTAFSRRPRGNKLGQRVFDAKISMSSDPADPDGGFCPWFKTGFATPAMTWVDRGVLKNLAYDPGYAMVRGKTYADQPASLRLSGGTTSIDEMIANCEEGIYVNRFSGLEEVDRSSGLLTGVTIDGCFLIRHGKIEKPIKNFRFLDSPHFLLNKIEALGVPVRATFGYTPSSPREPGYILWPRQPIIVPPMMVRDFNFTSLADAV